MGIIHISVIDSSLILYRYFACKKYALNILYLYLLLTHSYSHQNLLHFFKKIKKSHVLEYFAF